MIVSALENVIKKEDLTISISIPDYVYKPLGLECNSKVHFFRYIEEGDPKTSGLVFKVIPDSRASEDKIFFSLDILMSDEAGIIYSLSNVFESLSINILSSQNFSINPGNNSYWKLIIEQINANANDNSSIKGSKLELSLKQQIDDEIQNQKQKLPLLKKVKIEDIKLLKLTDDLKGYDKMYQTLLTYGKANKANLQIINEPKLIEWIEKRIDKFPKQAILYGDPSNSILTLRFLPENIPVIKLVFTHKDEIGVIKKITKFLLEELHADIKYMQTNILQYHDSGNTSEFYVNIKNINSKKEKKEVQKKLDKLINEDMFKDILDSDNPPKILEESLKDKIARKVLHILPLVYITSLIFFPIVAFMMAYYDFQITYPQINTDWIYILLRWSIYLSVLLGFPIMFKSLIKLIPEIRWLGKN